MSPGLVAQELSSKLMAGFLKLNCDTLRVVGAHFPGSLGPFPCLQNIECVCVRERERDKERLDTL